MSKLIPLKPIGKEDIRKLEGALLTMVLYSQETLEMIRNPHERVTWIDSLYVAAASLAREKAGIPISKIAEELGITEASVRRHLRGESKAGELVLKAYETLVKEGLKINLPEVIGEELIKKREKINRIKQLLEGALKELENI